jgi:hypothetical protein
MLPFQPLFPVFKDHRRFRRVGTTDEYTFSGTGYWPAPKILLCFDIFFFISNANKIKKTIDSARSSESSIQLKIFIIFK